MDKFIHRVRLLFKKEITYRFLLELTVMDLGRWLFKKFHICNRCGSPNVVGYLKGLYCEHCIRIK